MSLATLDILTSVVAGLVASATVLCAGCNVLQEHAGRGVSSHVSLVCQCTEHAVAHMILQHI